MIDSKQKPKKISIHGSNGFEYVFLLKGGEDLRQDEAVQQIFRLANNFFTRNSVTARKNLFIQVFNVMIVFTSTVEVHRHSLVTCR